MHPWSPFPASNPSRLDATLDTLMRRVEHAATLRERQAAVDTLFAHRRDTAANHPSAQSTTISRNQP